MTVNFMEFPSFDLSKVSLCGVSVCVVIFGVIFFNINDSISLFNMHFPFALTVIEVGSTMFIQWLPTLGDMQFCRHI